MTMYLPPDVESRIREKLESGRFSDEGAVVRAALSLLDESDERDEAQLLRVRKLVLVGFESGGRRVLDDELWDELDREAEAAYQRGELPDPDVCP